MRLLTMFLLATTLDAQTAALRPLHVSPAGIILDDAGKPVLLRGVNRSATGSGNADANTTDQEYAAQNQLLSMNLVRIFVNAAWWSGNVKVPVANLNYQDYIDQLIQRAKKYGNYALVLKAGQFPDAPCAADGRNCPATNQGDLNCQANGAVCAAQDTTGNTIDTAFTFWSGFARKYAADPAVLYDTWEDMHGIDSNTWSDSQNQLIAVIRTYNPQSVIFVEDTGTAFESIASGAFSDLAWSNLVWNFHVYAGTSGSCTEPSSPRYANWPQNFDPLVAYAQRQGHAAAITEWGGCNDSEPYHTNLTSYAKAHSVALAYFDSSNLISLAGGNYQLTTTGSKVAQAYSSIAAGGPGQLASVNSASGANALAPETIALGLGANLSTGQQQAPAGPYPASVGGTSVQINDANGILRYAGMLYAFPNQLAYEIPPGVAMGPASVTVTVNGNPVAFGNITITPVAPGLYTANQNGQGPVSAIVVTYHANGTSGFVTSYQCNASGCTTVPIDLGLDTDQVVLQLYGTGIRNHSAAVTCKIGSVTITADYAGPQGLSEGLDQVNVFLPKSLRGSGNTTVVLTVDGQNANLVNLSFK